MSPKRQISIHKLLSILIFGLLPALIVGFWALSAYYRDLPKRVSSLETLVLGQNRLTPGSQAALRVITRDGKDGTPQAEAQIQIYLRPPSGKERLVYTGQTDRSGTAQIAFQVPDQVEGEYTLIVETQSRLGRDRLERPVQVQRDYRLLLSSDKPVYQPGQIMHLRLLALGTFDLKPAVGETVEITIADGKGNKVFRKQLTTSAFGVAAVDFPLAAQVNTGAYKITATLRDTSSEKTVTVEHYVLPKFSLKLQTASSFYRPGEQVRGTLEARYFYGKPVAGAPVTLQGSTFDVERTVIFELQGTTDAQGVFEFSFDLPTYFAGSDLEGGLARFYLQASVTDLANHTENANLSLPISTSPLIIEALPEGGRFRPGIENILYILTSYPDGTPAVAQLAVAVRESGQIREIQTGPYGLAEVRFTPQSAYQEITIQARDPNGHQAERHFAFENQEYRQQSILLRPEKPVYRVGEAMRLQILTSQPQGTVYLDLVRENQTVSTRAVEIQGGQAEVTVDLTPDLFGTLALHAYKILPSGEMVRDTRLVVVDQADTLQIAIQPDPNGLTLRPGETSTLEFLVSGADGTGVPAALGIAIVDEAVFALAEQDPGFARLYFLLEQELLQPKYDLHGFSLPDLVSGLPESNQELANAVGLTAQASLDAAAAADFPSAGALFKLAVNSRQDNQLRIQKTQQSFFRSLSSGIYALLLMIPLAAVVLGGYAVYRQKKLTLSLMTLFALLFLLTLFSALWLMRPEFNWAQTPLERLALLLEGLFNQAYWLIGVLTLCGLIGYLAMAIYAWVQEDAPLGWSLVLIIAYGGLLILAVNAVQYTRQDPEELTLLLSLAAFLFFPLAFLLRSAGFAWSRRFLPAIGTLSIGLFLLFGLIPSLAMISFSAGTAMAGDELQMVGAPVGILPLPTEAPIMEEMVLEKGAATPESAAPGSPEPPRLRQYFPETMLWLPEAMTDAAGRLQLDLQAADSITTWRITALASSQDGRLGSTTAGLRVFQDFFVDLDLPLALTVGDEISLPVGVFNYLTEAQTVRLELQQEPWFELLDQPVKELEIAANDIQVVYFRIRAAQFGLQPFQVTAYGSRMSDAIRKEVRVYPNGRLITNTQSDRLEAQTPIQQTVNIPADAIPGTPTLLVKIYPGIFSQVVEGLDSILRMPYGCFEQTSSTTYPNVLVLDYLKTTAQLAPEAQMKAEEYINLGYQRLTTFEVQSSGGFSLFGEEPADRMLTAYGLQEFADMQRVYEIDPALIQRAAEWLFSQQASDGSWENDRGLVHENTWSSLGNDRLPVTAYIAWSLITAGYGADPRTANGIAYVREHLSQAEDPYVLALVANALVADDLAKGNTLDGSTTAVLDRLASQAQRQGNAAFWQSSIATFMGGEGQTGSIETTALAALALQRAGAHPDLSNAALTYLVQQKDGFGTWYSTQATVLSLKALLESVRAGGEQVDAQVTITLNGGQSRTMQVTPENFDVVQLISFDDLSTATTNTVQIQMSGKGNLMYQISSSYYLPWDKLALYPDLLGDQELVTIGVQYDRTELSLNDTVQVNVTITLNQPDGRAEAALVDLGLPPGFTVLVEDLQALVARYQDTPADYAFAKIERFELTGRQILLYLTNLSYGQPLRFSYRLQAKYPLSVLTPASSAYDYYNPDISGLLAPQSLVVNP